MSSTSSKERTEERKEKQNNQRVIIITAVLALVALVAIFYRPKHAGFSIDEAGMTTTPSGLKYKDVNIGSGAEAQAGDLVSVHYSGYLTDGTKFDSSVDREQPFQFQLGAGNVIAGWDEGVAGMRVGGKRQLLIPPELGYGANGAGEAIPPNATLFFEVELLEITASN
jgi:FKBP-type peptidyl-prolyl cis-trans isomerase FkpA